jgi:hypothetical protein
MSTRDDRLLAGRQVLAKVFQSDVKAVFDGARKLLEPQLAADESVAAELPDGTRIGSVKRSKAPRSAGVTDSAALLEWVKTNRPDEVIVTETVNPTFVAFLQGQAKKHGLAVLDDGTVVPGVEMRTGTPSYLPQVDQDVLPLVRARLAELVAGGLLALPEAQREAS